MRVRLVLLPALLLAAPLLGADWLRFRGPNGTGVAVGSIVERPSLGETLLWKTPLPPGHSSPVITSTKIFVTAVENEKLYTLALERETGEILWRREAPRPRHSELQENNNPASPTPASDGENVYVFFGEMGIRLTQVAPRCSMPADGRLSSEPDRVRGPF